jgi:hypothetical protein
MIRDIVLHEKEDEATPALAGALMAPVEAKENHSGRPDKRSNLPRWFIVGRLVSLIAEIADFQTTKSPYPEDKRTQNNTVSFIARVSPRSSCWS